MLNDLLGWIFATVDGVDPVVRVVVAGVAVMLETSVLLGVIVPGDTIVIVAAIATPNPLNDPTQYLCLIAAIVLGALCGESAGFAIGRWFGPRLRASALGRRIGERHWVRAERFLTRRGGVAIFVSRFLPVLHSLVPLTVGMSGMRYRTFVRWTLPACVLWAAAYVTVGTTAAGVTRTLLAEQLKYAGFVFVGIVVLFLVVVWAVKRVLHVVSERHMRRADHEEDAHLAESPPSPRP